MKVLADGELAVLSVAVLSLIAGAIPGAWVAFRRLERSRGHLLLAGVVGILAVAAVTFYTVAGASEELFSRVVMLPLTLLIAVAVVGVLVGIPMYAAYLFAYRLVTHLFRKGG
jgi:hypothetical protein